MLDPISFKKAEDLQKVFNEQFQTSDFKVIYCSVDDLDNVRDLFFPDSGASISYLAITGDVSSLSVWGGERKTSASDYRIQVRLRVHLSNNLQSRYYFKGLNSGEGWYDWINR